MQTKFNYVSSGLFTNLTGGEYSGYIHVIDDATAYTGKYPSDGSIELKPVNKFASDRYLSRYFLDRHLVETLTLPNPIESIIIEPNEIVNYFTLNTKIQLLFDNLIYTYANLFLGSTNIPVNYTHTLGVTGQILSSGPVFDSTFKWVPKTSIKTAFAYISAVPTLSANVPEFDNLKKFVTIPYIDQSGYGILGITDTHIIGMSSNNVFDQFRVVLYTSLIDNNTDEHIRKFEDITFDSEKYAFISDSKTNQIYKYDILGYFNNDTSIEFNRYLVETVGGIGNESRTDKFNKPTILGSSNTAVLVYDSANNCIKCYDTNLNYKATIHTKHIVKDIQYRKINDTYYILLVSSSNKTILQQYNNVFIKINEWEFEDQLEPEDGSFHSFQFAEQDSNVFYVITDRRVFKKYVSKPNKTLATFQFAPFIDNLKPIWNKEYATWNFDYFTWNYSYEFISTNTIKDINVLPLDINGEDMFLLINSRIIHLQERTDYETLLSEPYVSYYNLDSIKFNKDEYVQSITFNKELFKLYKNTLTLKDLLLGKFSASYDEQSILRFKGYSYITNDDFNNITLQSDFDAFINNNELVQSGVINQIFIEIYNIQEKLLSLTQTNILNPIDSGKFEIE